MCRHLAPQDDLRNDFDPAIEMTTIEDTEILTMSLGLRTAFAILAIFTLGLISSSHAAPTAEQTALCQQLKLDADQIASLVDKPLYEFTELEVDAYLKYLAAAEPDLRRRIVHLARKNLGQPYELYLLGEMPFEPYDPQPIYCLTKSDCVVFAEHTYAMALTQNWPSFMKMLQRIRYRDGQLGVTTRNHYTEADWNPSNRWLVEDITANIAGDSAVKFSQKIDRARFFKNRYKLSVDVPIQKHEDTYLPYEELGRVQAVLQDGDFVNVVRAVVDKDGTPTGAFVGHVGLIAHSPTGGLHMIHSTEPKVREEPLAEYIARSTSHNAKNDAAGKPRLVGFKFLRLRDKPLDNLRGIDGPAAPRVTLPAGDEATL